MKITHDGPLHNLAPWQEQVAGFSLPFWMCAAPSAARWLWPQLASGAMPALLESVLNLWGLWVFAGAVLAMGALSSDFHERTSIQRVSRCFMLGAITLLALMWLFA